MHNARQQNKVIIRLYSLLFPDFLYIFHPSLAKFFEIGYINLRINIFLIKYVNEIFTTYDFYKLFYANS